jgi:ABC-2 type transport system permease protein
LIQLLVGDLAIGLGLTGLVVSPAFGYAGVGFPTVGMNTFAQIWGGIPPVRWYKRRRQSGGRRRHGAAPNDR